MSRIYDDYIVLSRFVYLRMRYYLSCGTHNLLRETTATQWKTRSGYSPHCVCWPENSNTALQTKTYQYGYSLLFTLSVIYIISYVELQVGVCIATKDNKILSLDSCKSEDAPGK